MLRVLNIDILPMKVNRGYSMSKSEIIKLNANPEGFGCTSDKLEQAMFTSKIPVQHTHIYYEDEQSGIYIGVWDTTDMVEVPGSYGCDEFMLLLEGSAEIKNNKTGKVEKVNAGETFVIPWVYDCQWHQVGYLRKFFVIHEHANETKPNEPSHEGIIIPKFDDSDKSEGSTVCYKNKSETFSTGLWQSEPFGSRPSPFTSLQFIYLVEGSLIITDDNDHHFNSGDAFIVPKSVNCHWKSSENVKLIYTTIGSLPL